MPTTRATKEAAQTLGVSVGTMRNWSDQYAAFLSETARPGHQPERRFTDHDITILTYIKQLRGEGMQAEQIRERLAETTFTEGEIIQQQTTIDDDKPQQTPDTALKTSPEAPEASILAVQVLDAINAQNRRIEALEHGRRDNVIMLAVGFMLALLFVLVIIGLAVLWGGFR